MMATAHCFSMTTGSGWAATYQFDVTGANGLHFFLAPQTRLHAPSSEHSQQPRGCPGRGVDTDDAWATGYEGRLRTLRTGPILMCRRFVHDGSHLPCSVHFAAVSRTRAAYQRASKPGGHSANVCSPCVPAWRVLLCCRRCRREGRKRGKRGKQREPVPSVPSVPCPRCCQGCRSPALISTALSMHTHIFPLHFSDILTLPNSHVVCCYCHHHRLTVASTSPPRSIHRGAI